VNIKHELTEYGIGIMERYVSLSRETVNSITTGDAFIDNSGDKILEVLLSQDKLGESEGEWQAMKNHVANGVYMTQAAVSAAVVRLILDQADDIELKFLDYTQKKIDAERTRSFWLGFSTAGIILCSILMGLLILLR